MAITTFGDYDAWQRHALISVDDGTTAYNFHALTETIDIDIGEKDIDVINLLNLGQITKYGAIGITTVTLEGYALEVGSVAAGGATVAATGFWDVFAQKPRMDTGEPQISVITNDVTRYRISVLWTNDDAATAGSSAVTSGAGYFGKRFCIADAICTACKQSFTDGVLKTTLTFKGAAFEKAANARIQMASGHDTTPLTALSTYTAGETDPF